MPYACAHRKPDRPQSQGQNARISAPQFLRFERLAKGRVRKRGSAAIFLKKNILIDVYILLLQTETVQLASLFKCLSDPTRLRIVNLLLRGPLCVCDIQHSLGESQVKMSKHLGYMKRHGLLTVERKANWNFYAVSEDLPLSVADCLDAIKANASRDPQLDADLEQLRQTETTACC